MESKYGFFTLLVFACFFFPMSHANWDFWKPKAPTTWDFWKPKAPRTLVVGGSQHWQFGLNYTDWAFKSCPFYLRDTLVFMYDAPNATTFPHNVYLLPDIKSFTDCNFTKALLIANETQGGGRGFNFTLTRPMPYFFACGQRNGLHCKAGLMKFAVWPTW